MPDITPFESLRKLLQGDPDYAWSWQCNLAMSVVDEGVSHEVANRAAARFMFSAFGVDVTQLDPWQSFPWATSAELLSGGGVMESIENTDQELWREQPGDYYAASIHVTEHGDIGIDVGGHVLVAPIHKWHEAGDNHFTVDPESFPWTSKEPSQHTRRTNAIRRCRARAGQAEPEPPPIYATPGVVDFINRMAESPESKLPSGEALEAVIRNQRGSGDVVGMPAG